jgi:hypothetical protein
LKSYVNAISGYSKHIKPFLAHLGKGNVSICHHLDEISNLYRGPSIEASYQISVHLAMLFQRRTFLKIDQSETRIACGGHVC